MLYNKYINILGGVFLNPRIKRGQILKELRKQKKIKQSELAEMLGITQQAYQRYEYGTSEPNADGLILLANFYNVSVDYLLDRETQEIADFKDVLNDLNLSEDNEKDVIDKYMSLPDGTRAVLFNILVQLGEAAKGKQQQIHNSIQQSTDRMITNRIVAFGGNNSEEEISEDEFIERYKAIKERKKREREEKK